MKYFNYYLFFCPLVVLSVLPKALLAQDSDSDGGRGIEEVVVTVERRETNLQDFAGTAVSISAEELDMGGIINIADLAAKCARS